MIAAAGKGRVDQETGGGCAAAFDLERHIRLSAEVNSARPSANGAWKSRLDDGSERACTAFVLATGDGCEWSWPELPGEPELAISQAREYRTPGPFAGLRVLVIGPSRGAEIASEIG